MATPQKGCITRLQKELRSLLKDPVPHIQAHPSPSNLLEWHFVLEGAPGTDYEGGWYHGKLVFPPNYPFKPPSISIFTPNGRFDVNTKLCLSITDYHPESWNPMWSVGTILTGLLSFMYDDTPTRGSVTSTRAEKQQLAAASLDFNARNPMFRKLFPDLAQRHAPPPPSQQPQQQQQPGRAPHPNAADPPQPRPGTQQQQQQQQQQLCGAHRPPAAAAAAGGPAGAPPAPQGGGLLTVALLVLVLALAAVPLLHSGGAASIAGVAERLSGPGQTR